MSRSRLAVIPQYLFSLVVVSLLVYTDISEAADKFKTFNLETPDGETRTLDDFRNKATLIAFFYPTCTYCNQAFPETLKVYEKYRDQGLSMVWINIVEEEEEMIPDWLAEHQYNVPVLVGAAQQYLLRRYDLQMTPTHFIVNADREILFKQIGYKTGYEKELEQSVRQALNLAP